MKKTLFRKLQFAGNISLIIIAFALCVMVVKQFWSPSVSQPIIAQAQTNNVANNPSANLVGKSIPLPGVEWGKSKKNLVLYLSNTCHFCTESAGFYKELVEESAKNKTNLVAVLPQPVEEGQEYLKKLEVKIENVLQSSPNSIGLRGTPTILLTDEKGVITDVWMGKLSSDRESQVLSKLES